VALAVNALAGFAFSAGTAAVGVAAIGLQLSDADRLPWGISIWIAASLLLTPCVVAVLRARHTLPSKALATLVEHLEADPPSKVAAATDWAALLERPAALDETFGALGLEDRMRVRDAILSAMWPAQLLIGSSLYALGGVLLLTGVVAAEHVLSGLQVTGVFIAAAVTAWAVSKLTNAKDG
jgi:hypothetical protein